MLTQKEKDIVLEAKLLWEKNAKNKFINGHTAFFNFLKPIWEDGSYIEVGYNICPMCREYLKKEGNCNNCLFIKILGKNCADSGGRNFCRNPNLDTCNDFIKNFDYMLT